MSYNRVFYTISVCTSSFIKSEQLFRDLSMIWDCNKVYEDDIEFKPKKKAESTENTESQRSSLPEEYVENPNLCEPVLTIR